MSTMTIASAAASNAPVHHPLTPDQLRAYRSALQSPTARRAAERAVGAIRAFARNLRAADLMRGSVVHGAELEAWMASIESEAAENLSRVQAYRSMFEAAMATFTATLHARDSAALELLARRRDAAAMKASKAAAIPVDVGDMRARLIAAGLTPEERDEHIRKRYAEGGFEAMEAELLRERDVLLSEAAALLGYLDDPDRDIHVLPETLCAELVELANAMPLRGQMQRTPVASPRA